MSSVVLKDEKYSFFTIDNVRINTYLLDKTKILVNVEISHPDKDRKDTQNVCLSLIRQISFPKDNLDLSILSGITNIEVKNSLSWFNRKLSFAIKNKQYTKGKDNDIIVLPKDITIDDFKICSHPVNEINDFIDNYK